MIEHGWSVRDDQNIFCTVSVPWTRVTCFFNVGMYCMSSNALRAGSAEREPIVCATNECSQIAQEVSRGRVGFVRKWHGNSGERVRIQDPSSRIFFFFPFLSPSLKRRLGLGLWHSEMALVPRARDGDHTGFFFLFPNWTCLPPGCFLIFRVSSRSRSFPFGGFLQIENEQE